MTARRARRSIALVALGLTGLLAACGRPAGVDGDLTNNWPAMPAAHTQRPAPGACYLTPYTLSWPSAAFTTVPCTSIHRTETVWVADFAGDAAAAATAPQAGSAALAGAYQQCQAAATDYLGGDWHSGYLYLGIVVPSAAAWTNGARWFRCDVVSTVDNAHRQYTTASSSARGGLRAARPLAITCLILSDDGSGHVTDAQPAACTQPHNAELAGEYTAPDGSYPATQTEVDAIGLAGCQSVLARFLGFAGTRPANPYLATVYDHLDVNQWALGDREIGCYAVAFRDGSANRARMTGSVAGLGADRPAGY